MGKTMKKIAVMVLLSAAAWACMTAVASALETAVQTTVVRGVVGDDGGSGRYIGCAGDEQWDTALCVYDPVPTSSHINLGR